MLPKFNIAQQNLIPWYSTSLWRGVRKKSSRKAPRWGSHEKGVEKHWLNTKKP